MTASVTLQESELPVATNLFVESVAEAFIGRSGHHMTVSLASGSRNIIIALRNYIASLDNGALYKQSRVVSFTRYHYIQNLLLNA